MGMDWLLATDRHDRAADHIYSAATHLIISAGFDNLTVDSVARRAHCSRATVYRHTGGVAHLRETVLARAATSIIEKVEAAIARRSGTDRTYTALTVALREARAEPVVTAFLGSEHGPRAVTGFSESPTLIALVADLLGTDPDDALVATWFIRTMVSMLLWPAHPDTETQLLQRFLIPSLDAPPREAPPATAHGTSVSGAPPGK
ncbi:TetR/AcrR family transcriptional regulator [Nocardia nova]|jgi:AcrR family transcriptional regulator|uniref:TetR/AcrR family transcriptional regulator n=2 Tax=Nocardia nova TaxID=37330 RepID=UPI0018932F7B|nr:TetR/AcrR family transcriptional regulator [Nocardia nova]MBF6149374.1 TetR/AcrR family transcriptional regulator [Nocardia nova]